MIQDSILPIISEILPRLARIPKLTTALLYGSAARGELTETSDIDLMLVFDVPHNPETGGELETAHRILGEIKTERKLQIVPTNLKQALDPDFLDNITREGIIIYGKPIILTTEKLQLKPHVIYTYSVMGLPQIKKSKLQRALKGYKVVRKLREKVYKSEKNGLLKTLQAKKLGKGVIMVPQENSKTLEKLFTQHNIKHVKIKAWC